MKNFLLTIPKEKQVRMLEDSLRENKFSIFLELSKILLDAPLNKGGLESEIVRGIFEKHNKIN
jgi:hypothetical protein|tara:strand:- start:54 stop:242 length:189 start_codon:yes stop_codon:yes gene_type:complete